MRCLIFTDGRKDDGTILDAWRWCKEGHAVLKLSTVLVYRFFWREVCIVIRLAGRYDMGKEFVFSTGKSSFTSPSDFVFCGTGGNLPCEFYHLVPRLRILCCGCKGTGCLFFGTLVFNFTLSLRVPLVPCCNDARVIRRSFVLTWNHILLSLKSYMQSVI